MQEHGYRSVCVNLSSMLTFVLFVCLTILLMTSIGCREEEDSAGSTPVVTSSPGPTVPKVPLMGNLLANPGFEEMDRGWFAPHSEHWVGFVIDSTKAYNSRHSAKLVLGAEELSPRTQVWGVSQYVNPNEFPRKLAGWYLVEGCRVA